MRPWPAFPESDTFRGLKHTGQGVFQCLVQRPGRNRGAAAAAKDLSNHRSSSPADFADPGSGSRSLPLPPEGGSSNIRVRRNPDSSIKRLELSFPLRPAPQAHSARKAQRAARV
jgi:hypothetical protein